MEDLDTRIAAIQPDLVGIGAMTIDEGRLFECARRVRKARPDALILAGGPHASLNPGRCLEEPALDGVVIGEGERTVVELVDALARGGDPRTIAGTGWRAEDGQPSFAPPRALVEDLDDLPLPAWDLVDLDRYSRYFNFHDLPLVAPPYSTMITSRGCPWSCTFCHNLFGRRARLRSADGVVDEMERLVRRHGVHEIHIIDDVFNIDGDRLIAICDEILRRDLRIRLAFPNGIRGDLITADQLHKLRDAGCYSVNFALETASPRLQRLIGKRLDVDRVLENSRLARELGLIVSGFVMLGFPTETREEMEATVKTVVDSAFDMPRLFEVCPFPGTELFKQAAAEGLVPAGLTGDDFDYDHGAFNVSTLSDEAFADVVRDARTRIIREPVRRMRLQSLIRSHPQSASQVFDSPFWTSARVPQGKPSHVDWAFSHRPGRKRRVSRPTDALLLFPPAMIDFQYAELGMPQIAGFLRHEGFHVEQRDLNVEFVHHLGGRDHLSRILEDPGWRRTVGGPRARPGKDPVDDLTRLYRESHAARRALFIELQRRYGGRTEDWTIERLDEEAPNSLTGDFFAGLLDDLLGSDPPPVVGLSVCCAAQLGPALELAQLLKEAANSWVVVGGPWARAARPVLHTWAPLFDRLDAVSFGDGEHTLPPLIDALRAGRDPAGIAGLATKRGDRVVLGEDRGRTDVAQLPPADFEGLALDLYTKRRLPLSTRRTCPWSRCVFCHHLTEFPGGPEQSLPTRVAIDRMETLVDRHGIREFELANLSTPAAELGSLSNEILRRGLEVRWQSLARVEAGFDRPALEKLAAAGCRKLELGLESAVPEELVRLDKGIRVEQVQQLLDDAHGTGVQISLFVMSLPGQRDEELEETLRFCDRNANGLSDIAAQRFNLGLSSPAFQRPKKLGIEISPDAGKALDVFNLPYRPGPELAPDTFVHKTMGTCLRIRGDRSPSMWEIQGLVSRLRGPRAFPYPPKPEKTPADDWLTIRQDALDEALSATDTLALLAAWPYAVLLCGTDPRHSVLHRMARYAKILDPGRLVVWSAEDPDAAVVLADPYIDFVVDGDEGAARLRAALDHGSDPCAASGVRGRTGEDWDHWAMAKRSGQ